MEGAPALRPRGRGGADVDFLRGDGAVVADLPGGDAEGFLAEHVALFLDSFEISRLGSLPLLLDFCLKRGWLGGGGRKTYREDVGHAEDADDDA